MHTRLVCAALLALALNPLHRCAAEDDLTPIRQVVIDAFAGGFKNTQVYLGPNRVTGAGLNAADAQGVTVNIDGSALQFTWKQLKPIEVFYLARGSVQDEQVDALLLITRFALGIGLGAEMDKQLEKAEFAKPKEVGRIERLRAEIADQIAAKQPHPATPPTVNATFTPNAGAATPPPVSSTPAPVAHATGTNQEGRKLSALPKIDKPVLFNTPEADAVCAAIQVFPVDNPWNQDITKLPVHKDSDKIVAAIGAGKGIRINRDMNFVVVPANQARIPVKITDYPSESDKGPYPLPDNTPIEEWPHQGGTLDNIQKNGDGDRHAVILDPYAMKIYEFWVTRKAGEAWQGACEATFDLATGKPRPNGWTSSDAAGLPIFPSIVRFDEVERGMVEHALRFTVRASRRAYIAPATHHAGHSDDPSLAPMGLRFRLKASVNIDGMNKHAKAVALALKKYGMFVADNGSDWHISTTSDPRVTGLEALQQLKGSDFEAVETGPLQTAGR